jgi:glycosyltransferase EpsD
VEYLIVGIGSLENYLLKNANLLGIRNQVHFLGYRRDIKELLKISDIFCFPSFREGMPVSALEAMASGLPIIGSNIRGIKDCCIHNVTGILCSPTKVVDFKKAIERMVMDKEFRINLGISSSTLAKIFDSNNVNQIMYQIYSKL